MKINPNNKTGIWVYWAYLIGIFLILALPLLNAPPLLYPAAWGGSIVFRIIFSILLFLFSWELLFKEGYLKETIAKVKNIPWLVSGALAVFTVLVILSTIFSLQPSFSFWGSPSRGDGSLNLILYIAFAIFCYLAVKKEDWGKVFNAGILSAILVSLIAIAQQFKIFGGDFLVSYSLRPPSTLGNVDSLSTYLLLFTFLTFFFGVKTKKLYLKIFYFASVALFLFVIFLALSRATFLGLAAGLAWIFLFYNFKNKSLNKSKIIAGILLIALAGTLIYYANSRTVFPKIIEQNKVLTNFFTRLSLEAFAQGNGRISGWKIAWEGLKDKPLLGYGPENFSVAFDKHYNPKFTDLNTSTFGNTWWDRAHNVVFDIGVTMGIPALIAYLSLFVFLLLRLQKEKGIAPLMCLGAQATLIAYLVNNLFSFDTFGTYIIFFLIIGYSFYLISTNNEEIENQPSPAKNNKLAGYKKILIGFLFAFLIYFIWVCNINPLIINNYVNWSDYYLEKESKDACNKSTEKINKVLNNHSFLDNYVRLRYSDVLRVCVQKTSNKQEQIKFAEKAVQMGQEEVKLRPYYVRSWIYLGWFSSFLLLENPADENLKKLSVGAFQKAEELAPKRPEVFDEWGKIYWATKEYNLAEEKFNKCIELNPNESTCWWDLALTQIYLGNQDKSKEYLDMVEKNGFKIESETSLLQLASIYTKLANASTADSLRYYQDLAVIYEKLVTNVDGKNFQYHASLAFIYNKLGQPQKAAIEAITVFYLSPESRKNIEEFMRQNNYSFEKPNDFDYHFSLAKKYYQEKNYIQMRNEALIALYIMPDSREEIKLLLSKIFL